MNLFQEAKEVLDKSGKVNPLGPYGRQKLTGREVATYFRRNKVKDAKLRRAVEVALDLGGAMSVATREIKKFYGDKIANSPEVKNALKYANESVELTLDMINEDEVRVDHENPKDRGDQKKFRKVIQLGKKAKIKLLDGGGRGYRAQGNRAQVQKFKDLMSKEFGKSVSFNEGFKSDAQRRAAFASGYKEKDKKNEDAEAKAKLNLKHAQDMEKLKAKQEREKEAMQEVTTNMPEPVKNKLAMLRNKRMDVPYGSPEYKRMGKQIDQIMRKYSKKFTRKEALDDKDAKSVKKVVGQLKKAVKAHTGQVKSLEKDLQDQKLNEFDTVRKMWEDALEKKNLKETSESIEEGQFYGQDGMNKAAKKMFNKKTHIKLVKDKGSYQSATISRKDKKRIAKLKKDGYKEVPLESVNENYRTLARKGMGAEDKKSIKVGREVDYYEPKRGDKRQGKIIKMTAKGYTVQDDQDRKTYTFVYHDRVKAKKLLESLNEVTDKEINMAKKLSKDMEKVKKGYQQIAKTGDKTLKNTGFNPTYEAILKAQQKVLSLIGELNTMKIMSDRSASRKKDAQGRPIMSSNIMDSYRIMHEESMQDKLSKLFKMRDKKAIDGVANLLNMTSVKVLQSMQKQNPKGFERMAKKMGELPAMEGKEIIDEKLSREDLKLIDKMYDKKGNLTPIGKKVMEYGKNKKK